jgi:hypothetical protein
MYTKTKTFIYEYCLTTPMVIKQTNNQRELINRAYWNTNSYGNAIIINTKTIKIIVVLLCLITPFTNWIIIFVNQLCKSDMVIRYDDQNCIERLYKTV